MRRLRLYALAVIGMLVATTLAAPPTAAVAASCRYDTCEGHLAGDEGCTSDATVIGSAAVTDQYATRNPEADLYYSSSCEAVWIEFNTTDNTNQQVVDLDTIPEYGGVQTTAVELDALGAGDYVSTMVGWGRSVQACIVYFGPSCTGWR